MKSRIVSVFLALVLVLALLVACAPEAPAPAPSPSPTPSPTPPPGEKPTEPEKVYEVIISNHRDYTGGIAAVAERLWRAYDDYLKWQEENNPIPGVKITSIWEDTAYTADRYITAYKRFNDKKPVLQIDTSSTARSALGELCRRDKMPFITPGCGYIYGFFPEDVEKKGPSYSFYDRPPYGDLFAAAAMTFMGKWKEAGYKEKPKAMFISWDTPYGRGPVELGTPWAEEYGFEMLPAQLFPSGTTELISQLKKAKELGANLIYMNSVEGHYAMLLKDAKRLGVETGIGPGKVQFACGSETHNPDVIKMAGEAAEGCWSVDSYPDWYEDAEGVKLAKDLQMKYHGEVEEHGNYFMGMTYGMITWHLVKTAADKYGPDKITKEAINDLLCELRGLDLMGITPKWTYGTYERRPFKPLNVHEVRKGEWYNLGSVETPWLTPGWEEMGLPGWRAKE